MQLMMIGYNEPHIAASLRAEVQELKASPAVRIVDVLTVHKNQDGTMEKEEVADLVPEHSYEPGAIIDRLLTTAGAARTMGETPWTGPGYLFRGDLLPDPRATIPPGSGVLAILLEHRWAIPLRDTATEVGAYPIADGWMGREGLKDVQLLPQEDR